MADPTSSKLQRHIEQLKRCRKCPQMQSTPISGGAVVSPVLLVGQAPGDREPKLQRPFAWTAGRTLFRWFEQAAGITESQFRASVYMAATCRCFPGKKKAGGDRVPSPDEVANCASWLDKEIELLRPGLVLAVGKLAIRQFIEDAEKRKLDELVGLMFPAERAGVRFDVLPLPHPSGASPWPRIEPGKSLLREALQLAVDHAAFREILR